MTSRGSESPTSSPPATSAASSSAGVRAARRSPVVAVAAAARPANVHEWQLFAVLQRANLLQYYDIFLAQGGDDVRQLLEAGEEEFLEIMALVGMACKPLHVRRLQKALQEYGTNPARFHLMNLPRPVVPTAAALDGAAMPPFVAAPSTLSLPDSPGPSFIAGPSNGGNLWPPAALVGGAAAAGATANILSGGFIGGLLSHQPDFGDASDYAPCPSDFGLPSSSSPALTAEQVTKIAECASEMAKSLPEYEAKLIQNKKKISRELLTVMEMSASNPIRLDEVRRYAAIYGRFDAKRKANKALTLHEVSVNEAAAQVCLHRPALLTRRDELFPLARQVVRDAGYNYAKPSKKAGSADGDDLCDVPLKRTTPADSVVSSGDDRCQTPSSSAAGSPAAASSASAAADERLADIDRQIGSLVARQDRCQRMVAGATELSQVHDLQRELQSLAERQSVLADARAALEAAAAREKRVRVKREPSEGGASDTEGTAESGEAAV